MTAIDKSSASVATYAVMANILYDIPMHPFGLPLKPYIGAGLGYGVLNFGNAGGEEPVLLRLPQNNSYNGPGMIGFGSDGAFAYQAMVGTALPLRIVPGLDLTLEYRFFGTARTDIAKNFTVADQTILINGAGPSATTHNGFEAHDNAILIGLRYAFSWPQQR